jgi:hypothetical protein
MHGISRVMGKLLNLFHINLKSTLLNIIVAVNKNNLERTITFDLYLRE